MSEQEKAKDVLPEAVQSSAPKARKPFHGFRIEKVDEPENSFELGLETMPESDLLSGTKDEGNPYK